MAGDRFASVNPARPAEVIAEFDISSVSDVDDAVARATDAQRSWARVPVPQRAEVIAAIGDVLGRTLAADLDNVRTTLGEIEPGDFRTAVELLSDRRRRVFVVSSEVSGGAGRLLAGQLDLLRDGVHEITGTPVKVSRDLVRIEPEDVVVVVDLRRYERWLLETTARAADTGATLVALTDGRLSPLAERAAITFVVAARGVGPFDSTVGAMSLVHALIAAVAARLRRSATGRLDAVEESWRAGTDLVGQ